MTDKPENVRIAMPHDEEAICELLIIAHKENGFGKLDPVRARETIRRGTQHQGLLIGVIDGEDGLKGSIGIAPSQYWYSPSWHLEEMWNFVHPDNRRSEHAKHLIQFAKWAAETMHMPLLVGIITHSRMDAKMRLYQRQINQCGAYFLHNAPEGFLHTDMN